MPDPGTTPDYSHLLSEYNHAVTEIRKLRRINIELFAALEMVDDILRASLSNARTSLSNAVQPHEGVPRDGSEGYEL